MALVLPIVVWCIVSYVPFVWHPQIQITDPGSVDYLQAGMRMDRQDFDDAVKDAESENKPPPQGISANPIYLPAPHEVAIALYSSFTAPPVSKDGQWLHRSLWHSIQIIFWGFAVSSIIGVPLGVLCGTYSILARLNEPFIQFFSLPAGARIQGACRRHPRHLRRSENNDHRDRDFLPASAGRRQYHAQARCRTGRSRTHARHQERQAALPSGGRDPGNIARSLSRSAHPARLGVDPI